MHLVPSYTRPDWHHGRGAPAFLSVRLFALIMAAMRLSEFIGTNAGRILQEWEDFAKKLSGDASLPAWILRDHAGALIKLIAAEMETYPPPAGPEVTPAEGAAGATGYVAAHVTLRIESGFDLAQVIDEYRALRSSVLRLWREGDPDGFANGATEVAKFAEVVDRNLAAAVLCYKERESRYRDRFLGILSHDLRNPINAIQLNATLLAGQGLGEQQLQTVARILSSARRLSGMVNDILDFARGRLGSPMPITMAAANLGAAVREVVDEVRAANPGCVIDFEASGDLSGNWDADRLKQMVSNLLINAIQHGAGENAAIAVKGGETFVALEVRNQGPPIPAELLPNMFDPLVRGGNANREQTSLGLGLFIVKEIVSRHNGSIVVTSSADAGTTFVVRLPRRSP
jgi:signal transduction histidine kinase